MDKLAAMRTFVEIVDQGSLTGAARSLDRSLPTVVRTLASLERILGTRLLSRTTRRMSLTSEGRDYLERCRRILGDVEEAERVAGRAQDEPRGEIRMTAPVLFGQMHVAPTVAEFIRHYQKVHIDLLLLDRNVNLVDEGLDLALRIGHLADSSMVAIALGGVRRVVCASPALLEQTGLPAHPRDLAAAPCLRFRGIVSGNHWHFKVQGRNISVPVAGNFSCNQATAVAEVCAQGLGFGLFYSYQIAPLVDAGRLRIVLADFEPEPIPVNLIYPQSGFVSSRMRTLLKWMKSALAQRLAHI